MAEWIFLRDDAGVKKPDLQGTRARPFRQFDDGYEPNHPQKFGPEYDVMYLPVTREPLPVPDVDYNPVTQTVIESSTIQYDGSRFWEGALDPAYPTNPYTIRGFNGNWVVSYTYGSADLAAARTAKLAALNTDYNNAITTGTTVGGGSFRMSHSLEEQWRYMWEGFGRYVHELAPNESWTPPSTSIVFTDSDGLDMRSNTNTLYNRLAAYFKHFNDVQEVYLDAEANINAAADVAAVDAVTWTFP